MARCAFHYVGCVTRRLGSGSEVGESEEGGEAGERQRREESQRREERRRGETGGEQRDRWRAERQVESRETGGE